MISGKGRVMAIAKLRMIVWNVKRGNAISLHLPNGKVVMVDCGSSDDVSPVSELKRQGVDTIHTLIITHPHSDHMADIEIIRKSGMGPNVLLRPNGIPCEDIKNGNTDQEVVNAYLAIDSRYIYPVALENDICNPACTAGVGFKVFKPNKYSASDLNNRSLVVVLTYGGTTILLPGDCTPAAMKELLENHSFVDAIKGTNVLIAPHHGHESCYCKELMELIRPWICIASDGRDVQEVSAISKYGEYCSGIRFRNRDRQVDRRVCLTTRYDGDIVVDIPCCGGVFVNTIGSGLEQC